MHKIDRLAGILMILQSSGKSTAAKLAATYEVSRRTIYRDIQSLSELGVPVVAEPGVNGGYSLMDGYEFQSVALTAGQAEALYLGAGFIASQEGFPLAEAAQQAIGKLSAFLPEDSRRAAEEVRQKISFEGATGQGDKPSPGVIGLLRLLKPALDQRQVVELEYEAIRDGAVTQRQVEPHNLLYENEAWYLVGHCRLRRATRHFRLSRVRRLEVLEEPFSPPNGSQSGGGSLSASDTSSSDCNDGLRRAPDGPGSPLGSEEATRVRVRRDTPLARHIEESPRYRRLIYAADDDGWFHLSFPAEGYSREYLVRILLGFGDSAEVVGPDSIRREFASRLAAMAALYPSPHVD